MKTDADTAIFLATLIVALAGATSSVTSACAQERVFSHDASRHQTAKAHTGEPAFHSVIRTYQSPQECIENRIAETSDMLDVHCVKGELTTLERDELKQRLKEIADLETVLKRDGLSQKERWLLHRRIDHLEYIMYLKMLD